METEALYYTEMNGVDDFIRFHPRELDYQYIMSNRCSTILQ